MRLATTDPHLLGCPLPCNTVNYELKITYYHETAMEEYDDISKFGLSVQPKSNLINDQVEAI
jgi:hypothetical protein